MSTEAGEDQIENGRPYLVMERIQGESFPGQRRPCAWADIADVTASLLETMAHVHAGFVVHRDLKPENVLITPERQVKVLDFGLVHRTDAMAQRFTRDLEILGTPAYRAPEQLRGSASERSDLYAVGVMVYEALAGRLPYNGATLGELLRAQKQAPVPLAEAAPGVPAAVARVVEELIAYDPEARPRSAADALRRLRGEVSVETPQFSWLGPQDTLHALVRAARAGRSVDLVGPRGVGKTLYLRALAQVLGDERRVVFLTPSERAFGSLSPLVGALADHAVRSLAEVGAVVEAEVRQALAGGAVLLADDAEQLDRASLNVLAACRAAGTIVRVRGTAPLPDEGPPDHRHPDHPEETLTLSPLREEHLRGLFAGPDRLLHLREDAARVLHMRTEGMPGRIIEELATWLRLGVARWKRNLLVVHRAAIEALESGLLHAAPIDPSPVKVQGVPDALVDLLVWLTLAWPHADAALIATASGEPCFMGVEGAGPSPWTGEERQRPAAPLHRDVAFHTPSLRVQGACCLGIRRLEHVIIKFNKRSKTGIELRVGLLSAGDGLHDNRHVSSLLGDEDRRRWHRCRQRAIGHAAHASKIQPPS
ncbi:serine/threonine-protein kinase [Sorangium sp. So ce296]|uniref:protein kinase domain-containing protein n=1 Tax=Sorangium sp. So ce296 TaxID=3133296 RepID=UPI003F5E528B